MPLAPAIGNLALNLPGQSLIPILDRWTRSIGDAKDMMPRRSGPLEESTMPVSIFIGTSVDGFIARPNGGLDFLPRGGGEPHGYDEFMASVDAIVIAARPSRRS
jgi:hypothetical protein